MAQARTIPRVCKQCGTPFLATKSEVNRGRGLVCSRSCIPKLRRRAAAERFWTKVEKTKTCWLWTGAKIKRGYGHFRMPTGVQMAHRVAYELLVGPVPEKMDLDHLCRVHSCVNPSHLEPVPHRVNCLRGDAPIAGLAKRTHCFRGHEFTADNTYSTPGRRRCRMCDRIRSAQRPERQTGHERRLKRLSMNR